MNTVMRISADTHLADLLASHPFLKDELPKINPKFKLLHTPLGKVMLGQATILEMSKRAAMDVNTLILAIEERIQH